MKIELKPREEAVFATGDYTIEVEPGDEYLIEVGKGRGKFRVEVVGVLPK